MKKFTKADVKVMTSEGIEETPGYEYTYSLADGNRDVPMHVCNMNGSWRVVDPKTGRTLCVGCKTRDEAVRFADSMEVKPVFTNLVDMAKYGKMILEFKEMCSGPVIEAVATPETGGRLVKVETKPKAPAKAKAPAKPKKTSKPKAPKPPEVEQATVISLDTMTKWCEGKPLRAHQKHPGSDDKVWVLGPSKPWKEELKAMGFKWARKSKVGEGWWAKPTA